MKAFVSLAGISCLAGVAEDKIGMLAEVLRDAGLPSPWIATSITVAELGRLAPEFLLCDVDDLAVDPLEMLRRLRFVLPECVLAVYTGQIARVWALTCHLAGANCLLSKGSSKKKLVSGLRRVIRTGCFTDPCFDAA